MRAVRAKEPSAPPHAFERDDEVPPDPYSGVEYCRYCGKPGRVGDGQHPVDAPVLSPAFDPPRVLPPSPPGAAEWDARVLGEGSGGVAA